MSEYKFVVYEKLDGDAHTSRMLEEEHGDVPEEITDKQLDSYRSGEKDTIMEDLLEKARTGSAQVILEKNLNDSKEQFGSKLRDSSTYEGNINKLEEKRIAQYNIEDEKYEPASETPKRSRWWEVKTDDGLKIAFKTAGRDDWEGLTMDDVDFDYVDQYQKGDSLDEDDLDFELDSLSDDFVGDDFVGDIDELNLADEDTLNEVSYEIKDIGGTPTAIGVIEVDKNFYDGEGDPTLRKDLEDHMSLEHEDLPFSMSSFDFSRLNEGIITFRMGTESFSIDEVMASSKKIIVEATKKN